VMDLAFITIPHIHLKALIGQPVEKKTK
jgi:hypothetical protein